MMFRRDTRILEGVELDSTGLPTAFRIWRAGDNDTDHGVTKFTDKSVKLLLSEQDARGNLYSIDVDHLSLKSDAPPEARKAVGWHRLEVRDGELWAVDVKWTDVVADGLRSSPPEWRYFSPAYDVDDGGQVISYLNTALTNNPATWNVTALAASRTTAIVSGEAPMKYDELMAAMKKMAEGDEDEGESEKMPPGLRERVKRALAMMSEDSDAADVEEDKKVKAAEDEDDGDEEAAEGEDKKAKRDTKLDAIAELTAAVKAQGVELARLRAERVNSERSTLLASRADVPEELRKTLEGKPIKDVREILAAIPKPKVNPAAELEATQKATRGASLSPGQITRLSPQASVMDQRMGFTKKKIGVKHEGNHLILGAPIDEPVTPAGKVGA